MKDNLLLGFYPVNWSEYSASEEKRRVKMLEPESQSGRAELTQCDDVWKSAYVRAPTAERLAFIVLLEL